MSILTQLQEKYTDNNKYTKIIIAMEFGRLGGVYEESLRWNNDEFIAYAHAKRKYHTLTSDEWQIIVNHEKECLFHDLSSQEIDTLLNLVPSNRRAFFQYLQTIAPNHTITIIPEWQAFNDHVELKGVARDTINYYMHLSETDKTQVSEKVLLNIFEHIYYHNETYTAYDNVLKSLFSHPTFPQFCAKTFARKRLPFDLIRHSPIAMKIQRMSWSKLLHYAQDNNLDAFKKFPEYISACQKDASLMLLQGTTWPRLQTLIASLDKSHLENWLHFGKKTMIEPWLWLPDHVLPPHYLTLREKYQLKPFDNIHPDIYAILVKFYENMYTEQLVLGDKPHLYGILTIDEIEKFFSRYALQDGSLNFHQIQLIKSHFTMKIPQEYIDDIFYPSEPSYTIYNETPILT